MPKRHAAGTILGSSTRRHLAKSQSAVARGCSSRHAGAFESLEGRLLMSATARAGAPHTLPRPASLACDHTSAAVQVSDPSTASTSSVAAAPSATAPLPGDANSDGTVGTADYATVVRNFGLATGATWAQG